MPKALLSVHNKIGLVELAGALHQQGWTLIASGSTAKTLREHQLPVTDVADYTQSPEMLNGRVKTLHPAIHAGILARQTDADHQQLLAMNWDYIDLVVVNLYPFAQTVAKPNVTLAEAIEQIDIGGVTLIRAAAKNHDRVTLLCDPEDYATFLDELHQGDLSKETRKRLAIKGFVMTSRYDASISRFLDPTEPLHLTLYPQQKLRYGENPHQSATLYSDTPDRGPLGGELLQGKALSYNNLLDADAAWRTVLSFTKPTVCFVKHLSPCGIASANSTADALTAALAADPISAFGGIVASNKPLDAKAVQALGDLFIEAVAAPDFSNEARTLLAERRNCRLLKLPDQTLEPRHDWRSIHRGVLCQTLDLGDPTTQDWQVVSKRQPTENEWTALRFAWQACQHVRSNAIVLAQGEQTVGIGGGLTNRIDCVRLAIEHAGARVKNSALASDAFFPFTDCIELAAQNGVTAIIHPGGSLRDAEVIAAADAANIAMVLTGIRHFRH